MNKKAVEWLYRELPGLVDKEIITGESAERLKQHYGPVENTSATRPFLLVFSVLGASFVGLGIILILAHNWEQLTRLSRLVVMLGLLLSAQVLSAGVLWYKRDSVAWREGSALLLLLVLGAAIATIGQTYHLAENIDSFLLVWLLLSLPVIYLLDSTGAAVLYAVGATVWSVGGYQEVSKQFIWLLLGLLSPYYWRLLCYDRQGSRVAMLTWVVSGCFYVCFGAVFARHVDRLEMLAYSLLFGLQYLVGILWFRTQEQPVRLPFTAVGLSGSAGLLFVLSFHDIWRNFFWREAAVTGAGVLLLTVLLGLVIGGNILAVRGKNHHALPISLIPCAVAAAYGLRFFDDSGFAATVLLNAYSLWLGILYSADGIRNYRIGTMNAGMLLLAALIVARFFDMNVSFLARGTVFLLVGIGFLTANVVLVRRKAGWKREK